MSQVTKIYEVKSLGYQQLITELENIEKSFQRIKVVKQNLNNLKMSAEDAQKLADLNKQLDAAKIKTAELTLKKRELTNASKASSLAKQEEKNASKGVTDQNKAEAGSLTELIKQQKELKAILSTRNPNNQSISYNGQVYTYQQLLNLLTSINGQVRQGTANLRSFGQAGEQSNRLISSSLTQLKGALSQVIFMYGSWYAAFRVAGEFIAENKRLSDSFTDLQIRIKGTTEEVEALFEQLKQIPTRTSLEDLVNIANVVAKKGVPKEEIAGLTQEFDRLNVVLGKEIGEPDHAAALIIKLITVFNDDKHVTAERVREIGTELFKLTTTGVATGEFLVNFAERVGAVRGITGLTLPSILGMGAALQQLGQRVELSSTAIVQLTTRVFANIPKFAAAAGKSVEDLRKLLVKDPFEALIAVANGLKDIPLDKLESEFEEIVSAFNDVNITGVRVKSILGDIATNGKFVQERMDQAKVSTADLARQMEASALKQNTFAATLDRIRKTLEQLATDKGVRLVLSGIAVAILAVVSSLNIVIPILGIYAVAWTIANAQMIATRVISIALAAALKIKEAALILVTAATRIYSGALAVTNTVMKALGVSTITTTAILTTLGGALAILVVGMAAFYEFTSKTVDKLDALNKQQRIAKEVTDEANKSVGNQITKLEQLIQILQSSSASVDTKRKAINDLIDADQRFSAAIKDNVVNLNTLKSVLQQVRDEIMLTAQATAAASLASDKFQNVLEVKALRQSLEGRLATSTTPGDFKSKKVNVSDIQGPQKDLLYASLPAPNPKGDIQIGSVVYDSKQLFANLKAKEKQANDNYLEYQNFSTDLAVKAAEAAKKANDQKEEARRITLEDRIGQAQKGDLTSTELQNIIDEIKAARAKLKEGDTEIDRYNKLLEEFQARLDKINNKKQPFKWPYMGARVTGEFKDDLSRLEAERNTAKALRERDYLELQLDHRVTLDEEIKFYEDIRDIDKKYLNDKIKYLEDKKSLNAKEIETLAGFKKEYLDIELRTQRQIQAAKDREFQNEKSNLKNTLDNKVDELRTKIQGLQQDQSLSEADRVRLREGFLKQILDLQLKFNDDIDFLEKKLNQKSKENQKEGEGTRREIAQTPIDALNAQIQDIQNAADKVGDDIQVRAFDKIQGILESGKSAIQIAKDIQQVNNQLRRDLLVNEAAGLKLELDRYKEGLDSKLKSEKDYADALKRYKDLETQIVEDSTQRQLTALGRFVQALKNFKDEFKENVLGIKTYTDDPEGKAQKEADAIRDANQYIKQAMDEAYQSYWQHEQDKIELSRKTQQERLDIEKGQVIARAQSQAEIDAIENRYAAKKKELDRKAGEEKKALALKKLAIDFALMVAMSLAQYGFPLALIPIAAGAALYFVQKASIQAQQFEQGGEVPSKGGKFGGRRHSQGGTPFMFKGRGFEAEVDELAIVRTRNADPRQRYTISGNQMEIASMLNELGGGSAFRPGAIMNRFAEGGVLGSSYPAPYFRASNQPDDLSSMILETRDFVIATNKRIDRLEVVQDTNTVLEASRKIVKQKEIAVL